MECKVVKPAMLYSVSYRRGGGRGYPTPKVRSPTPRIPRIKFIIMILTQLYNLQSDLPVPLFKNVKDFIKIDST